MHFPELDSLVLTLFDGSMLHNPDPARSVYECGHYFLMQKKTERAIQYFEKAVAIEFEKETPDDSLRTLVLFSLAAAHRMQGNEAGAQVVESMMTSIKL